MRLLLKTTHNTSVLPYNYQVNLVGAFHKWLGENNEHNDTSLYSFSWLLGGKATKGGIHFRSGATWVISSYSSDLIKRLIAGIRADPSIAWGMEVTEIQIQEEPQFAGKEYFRLLSPVFIKRNIDGNSKYYLFSDKETSDLLTETLKTKLRKAGISDQGVTVCFDNEYLNPQTKMINYRGIDCKASICPVIVEGSSEQIAFAWNVGIGNSTGIGFGALK